MADHRLSVDGMCSRYGPALERMWAERGLAVPDVGVTSLDDDEIVTLVDKLRDLLEALVRQQAATIAPAPWPPTRNLTGPNWMPLAHRRTGSTD